MGMTMKRMLSGVVLGFCRCWVMLMLRIGKANDLE